MVPHTKVAHLKIRELELAKALSDKYKVYYVCWDKEASKAISRYIGSHTGFQCVYVPFVDFPARITRWYNSMLLSRVVRRLGAAVVLNASWYLIGFNSSASVKYIYDVVDNPLSFEHSRLRTRMIIGPLARRHLVNEAQKASCVITVSETLAEIINKEISKRPFVIPNGADVAGLRSADQTEVAKLRSSLGLDGRKVVSYIGNHAQWAGIDFLLAVIHQLSASDPDVRLLLVGPVRDTQIRRMVTNDHLVRFIPHVPPQQVNTYFAVGDVGVIPFDVTPFTSASLPIKAVEYSAARKVVVASPLRGLMELRFPNLVFRERIVSEWVEALQTAFKVQWKPEWDTYVAEYDWRAIAGRLESLCFSNEE